MKKKLTFLLIILAVIGTAVFVLFQYNKGHNKISYVTADVEKGSIINEVTSTGELQPVTKVDIGSQVSGKIISLSVDYNSRVRKGQAIVQIDDSLYRTKVASTTANLHQASADLAEAQSNYDNALINVRIAASDIETAKAEVRNSTAALNKAISARQSSKADIDSAMAKMKNSQAQQKRYNELFRTNYVSATDRDKMNTDYLVDRASYESSLAQYKSACDGVEAARAQLAQASSKLQSAQVKKVSNEAQAQSSRARVQSAQARVDSARGSLNEAQINLNYCTITSPIDGVVVSKDVEVGQTVQSSFQTPKLLTLAKDLKQMQITANVDEADISKVRLGQGATFSIESNSSEQFEGRVIQVRSSTKSTSGVVTYGTIIRTDNAHNQFKPGMTATVSIVTDKKEDVIKIPSKALRFKPENFPHFPYPAGYDKQKKQLSPMTKEVWVLKNGKPVPVVVELGLIGRKSFEMKSGDLKPGDRLIVDSSATASTAAK